jgi:hypothetical protein
VSAITFPVTASQSAKWIRVIDLIGGGEQTRTVAVGDPPWQVTVSSQDSVFGEVQIKVARRENGPYADHLAFKQVKNAEPIDVNDSNLPSQNLEAVPEDIPAEEHE